MLVKLLLSFRHFHKVENPTERKLSFPIDTEYQAQEFHSSSIRHGEAVAEWIAYRCRVQDDVGLHPAQGRVA